MNGNAAAETLSLTQITERFASEWILLINPETGPTSEVKGGQVVWHSPNRDEVYRKARELRPRHSAIVFTGRLSEETAVVL